MSFPAGVLKTTQADLRGAGHFVSGDLDPNKSNDHIMLKASAGLLLAGTVLGQITRGAATVTPTATAGNTGTGSIGTVTADAGGLEGDWFVEIIDANTDAGDFRVVRPDGSVDGYGTVAVAYNGGINFTLADATDFAEGDSIKVNVDYAAGSGQYDVHDPAATNGLEVAKCLLWAEKADLAATQRAVAVFRDAVVNGNAITWKSGMTTDQKNAAIAQLATAGLMVRV